MPKQIIIAEQHRIAAVFSEDQIQELIVATGSHQVGDIYLGVVENVLPGIDAAFVNIGDSERNGFIHVSDLGPLRLKRSAGAITELLAPQQKVLVQVMKEPTGTKGPRLTGNISLPGRYLVLMSSGRGVSLSRRIRNEDERSRLKALGILIKPAGMGLLVRTEAEEVSEEAIIEDLEFLQRRWEAVQQQATSSRAPDLLNRDDDFVQRVLRDVYSADVNRIVIDSNAGLKRVKQHLMNWNANRLPKGVLVDEHRDSSSILTYFRVNAAIREALKPRVDLPSGGYIIIERTEALTVIDVNSGSFTRSATARETVLWTNCEAATEIARQLRLRNIAGVIIVDFIDMDSRRDQLQVLEHFNKALKSDKARPQIAQLSELGLIELTRKRQGQNIYELFGRPCPNCGGLGHLAHLPGDAPDDIGESLESYAIPRPADFARRATPPPSLSTSLGDQLHLDPTDNLQELDLTNHPSYQERGTRRRRRARLGDTLSREPVTPKVLRSSPASARRGTANLAEVNGTGPLEKTGTIDRKLSRQELPKPRQDSNPEVITVTMTPEEQDVYAFMGISPLALFEGEVKNPKSAVIKVLLPGQSSEFNFSDDAQESISPTMMMPTPSIGEMNAVPTPKPSPVLLSELDSEQGATEQDPLRADSVAQETALFESEQSSAPPASSGRNSSPTRRRRRRSSADEGQLSLETQEG
jgi:ribonuclease E